MYKTAERYYSNRANHIKCMENHHRLKIIKTKIVYFIVYPYIFTDENMNNNIGHL
jgi:hypothetical protein